MIKQEHYDWNLSECMGTAASTSTGQFYPDWLGDDTCKNDGSAPEYMALNPTMWLHDTLSDCCKVCLITCLEYKLTSSQYIMLICVSLYSGQLRLEDE